MVQDLNHGTYKSALVREKVLARLGPELTADLFVNTSWRDRPPTGSSRRIEDQERPSSNQNDDDDDEMDSGADSNIARLPSPAANFGRPELVPGSNNWVVSGAHTVTGKPMLSNDMHLGHQMPNLWYEAHLRAADYDVIGVTLPGVPFVIVGHNRRVAWGFTNVGPTVEDLYIEAFNDQGALPGTRRLAAAATPSGSDPRQGTGRHHGRRGSDSARPNHHRPDSGRDPQDCLALDSLRFLAQPFFRNQFGPELE